jgi:hypothetical protein
MRITSKAYRFLGSTFLGFGVPGDEEGTTYFKASMIAENFGYSDYTAVVENLQPGCYAPAEVQEERDTPTGILAYKGKIQDDYLVTEAGFFLAFCNAPTPQLHSLRHRVAREILEILKIGVADA